MFIHSKDCCKWYKGFDCEDLLQLFTSKQSKQSDGPIMPVNC